MAASYIYKNGRDLIAVDVIVTNRMKEKIQGKERKQCNIPYIYIYCMSASSNVIKT